MTRTSSTPDERPTIAPSRRSILRAIGVGGGVTLLGGVASAKPGNRGRGRGGRDANESEREGFGDPKAACGGCSPGYTYTKFDGAPEVDDEYTLGSGAVVTVTEVARNDDDEVVGIQFTADGFVEKVCVKGGPVTEVYENVTPADFESRWFYAPENPNSGKRYQISNVAYCNAPADRYQADLVVGKPLYTFDRPDVTYTRQDRRLASNFQNFAIPGVSASTGTNPDPDEYDDPDECFTQTERCFHECLPTATGFEGKWVGADLSCLPSPYEITLAVYRIPAGAADTDLEQQQLVAAKTVTVSNGATQGYLSVDLTDGVTTGSATSIPSRLQCPVP
jgi:hypothetical protein